MQYPKPYFNDITCPESIVDSRPRAAHSQIHITTTTTSLQVEQQTHVTTGHEMGIHLKTI